MSESGAEGWLRQRLEQDSATIAREAVPEHIPDSLYHYTDPAGLIGIVSGQTMRASQAWFLNDPTEVEYGHEIVSERLAVVRQVIADEFAHELADRVAETWSHRDQAIDIFVSCLSAKGDLDNQWTDYAGNGGFSLGFGTREIPDRHMGCRQVLYKPDKQRETVNVVLAVYIQTLNECVLTYGRDETERLLPRLASAIVGSLAFQSVIIKEGKWEAEEEWRLVVWQPRPSVMAPTIARFPVNFRPSSRDRLPHVVPYIELDLRAEDGDLEGKLPIREVYVGPSSDVNLTVNGLTRVLHEYGYHSGTTSIRCSRLASQENAGHTLVW
jgi:hypothetical protein